MIVIYKGEDNLRLDRYLFTLQLNELYSRSLIQKMIEDGLVSINNKPAKKSRILVTGDTIEFEFPTPDPFDLQPEDIPLNIVFEDDCIAVINKPAGMVVHPGHGNKTHTLANALLHHFGDKLSHEGHPQRPGIVHRLDIGTTGVMVIAKTDRVHAILSDDFQNRRVHKQYFALVAGSMVSDHGEVESCIRRSPSNPLKMEVADSGRWSRTVFQVNERFAHFTALDVFPFTGRMHQIRVHLASIQYPILGDVLYGGTSHILSRYPTAMHRKIKALLSHLTRPALHACQITLPHPETRQEISFWAPIPEDLAYCLTWLRNQDSIDQEISS